MIADGQRWRGLTGAVFALMALAACAPVAMTAVSAGSSTAVSHTLNGITYRTFTRSSPKVRVAALQAMRRMEIKLLSDTRDDDNQGWVLKGRTSAREIEIEIDPISPSMTRVRVIAKSHAILYDSATATEIILQTERSLGKA